MNETPFQKFIALVELDQKINTLYASIASATEHINHQNAVIAQHHSMLEKSKQKLHDLKKEVDAKELEMKSLDQQESEKKKRLESLTHYKDYNAIKAEIDQVKQLQHGLEEDLIAAWNNVDNAKKEFALMEQELQQKSKDIHVDITKNNENITQLKSEIESLQNARTPKEQSIPEEWLQKYSIMRAKVTNPVVPVNNDNCSACFYKISAQDLQLLKRCKLVQCKDCFRLLYLAQAHQSSSCQDTQL